MLMCQENQLAYERMIHADLSSREQMFDELTTHDVIEPEAQSSTCRYPSFSLFFLS